MTIHSTRLMSTAVGKIIPRSNAEGARVGGGRSALAGRCACGGGGARDARNDARRGGLDLEGAHSRTLEGASTVRYSCRRRRGGARVGG